MNTIGCRFGGGIDSLVDQGQSGPGIKLRYGDAIYGGREILDKRFYTDLPKWNRHVRRRLRANPPLYGPVNREFLQIRRKSLVFDQNRLKGSSPGTNNSFGAYWKWDFH